MFLISSLHGREFVRTIREQIERLQGVEMIKEVKKVIVRSHGALIGDILGAASLCVMLAVALHLPAIV